MLAADHHAPRRWQHRPEERPGEILEAAFAAFVEQGLERARLDDIAARAGVSKGTIYLYFPSKEDLFRAVVEARIVSVIAIAEQEAERRASDDLPAPEDLRRHLVQRWANLRAPGYLAMYRLVQAELDHFPDLARFYGEAVVQRALRLTAGIVARGIARGEFRATDPAVTARLVTSMLLTQAVWFERRSLYDPSMSESPDSVRDAVVDFVLHSLASSAPSGALAPPHG